MSKSISESLKMVCHLCLVTIVVMCHCIVPCEMLWRPLANSKIVGGQTTTIERFPYLVNLRVNGRFSCGGSLITPTHVVTAAHCVKGRRASNIIVVGGETNTSARGVRRSVARIFIPQQFQMNTFHMDVAVLKLKSPMNVGIIRTIQLCDSVMQAGNPIQLAGWGTTSENSETHSNTLRMVTVPLIAKKRCTRLFQGYASLTQTMFCASVMGSKDTCAGDSGGPAIYNGQLCGIVSWGIGCARENFPGVYTNVRIVKPFILKAIQLSSS